MLSAGCARASLVRCSRAVVRGVAHHQRLPQAGYASRAVTKKAASDPSAKAASKARVEEVYSKKTPVEHVLLRPDLYVGPTEHVTHKLWVPDGDRMVEREVTFSPALLKIFDEIVVNALDNHTRGGGVRRIEISVSPDGVISVLNDGAGVPIRKHKTEKVYIPELVFGHLLTGSNFDDSKQRFTGGRMGYGAKLTNIFSTQFSLETADAAKSQQYRQQWSQNMSVCEPAVIQSLTAPESYTKVEFAPDFPRFGYEGLEADMMALFKRRAMDAAAWCGAGVRVSFNGELLSHNTMDQFMSLFGVCPVALTQSKDWRVGVTASAKGSMMQVSFVNGICTTKGGTHVAMVADTIAGHVADYMNKHFNKELAGTLVTPAAVRANLGLFVMANIVNPSFDAQMKEQLTTKQARFGTKCRLPASFLSQLTAPDSPVVEATLRSVLSKQQRELMRKSKVPALHRKKRRLAIEKLDDANMAGIKGSAQECTLILTEGDSAKSLAVAGLSVVGRDTYGVFPLKGKLLNARTASHRQLADNKELNNLKTILGLSHSLSYETPAELSTLRYGRVLLMTDQDPDGSHIKGLLINMLHHSWPALLRHDGFLHEFVTPLVKVRPKSNKKADSIAFYTTAEFEAWKDDMGPEQFKSKYVSKYYKGLGTSTSAEAREYFSNLAKHQIAFQWDEQSAGLIDLAFNKDRTEDRKDWLLKVAKDSFVDHTADQLTYSDFVNKELSLFSASHNLRSIPNMMDGLKPAQRKVLWSMLQRPAGQEIKVAQLSGFVSEKAAYHHGEASLQGTITSMAQNFVGSNNLPLLEPVGQFGTRLTGGKDAASPRYIFTKTSPLVPALFCEEDSHVLEYNSDDGQQIEPTMFSPVIPLVLVNGCDGIGTGWSTTIPPHHPLEVVDNVRRGIAGDPLEPMTPWAHGFTGGVRFVPANNSYVSSGVVSICKKDCIRITELPLYRWTEDYKKFLESHPQVSDFVEHHSERTVDFEVKFSSPEDLEQLQQHQGGLLKALKLESSIQTSNMHVFDEHGVLRKFSDTSSLLEHFVAVRRGGYQRRLEHLLDAQRAKLADLQESMQLAQLVLTGDVNVMNQSKQALQAQIEDKGGWAGRSSVQEATETLLRMPLRQFTKEEVDRQQAQCGKVSKELKRLEESTPEVLWLSDLDRLEAAIRTGLEDRA